MTVDPTDPNTILTILRLKELEAETDLAADEASPESDFNSGYLEGRYQAYSTIAAWLGAELEKRPRV